MTDIKSSLILREVHYRSGDSFRVSFERNGLMGMALSQKILYFDSYFKSQYLGLGCRNKIKFGLLPRSVNSSNFEKHYMTEIY